MSQEHSRAERPLLTLALSAGVVLVVVVVVVVVVIVVVVFFLVFVVVVVVLHLQPYSTDIIMFLFCLFPSKDIQQTSS